MIVLYCVEIIVPSGRDVVTLRICVTVLASRMEVSVKKNVLAGRMEVSVMDMIEVAVPVACGRVEVMNKVLAGCTEVTVLYCVEMIVSPGSWAVTLRVWVMVVAGRIEVSVRTSVLAGWREVSVIESSVVSVPVACGSVEIINRVLAGCVEMIVSYWVEIIVSPGRDVEIVRIRVTVEAGKIEVLVW
jgi:hypothetical protein